MSYFLERGLMSAVRSPRDAVVLCSRLLGRGVRCSSDGYFPLGGSGLTPPRPFSAKATELPLSHLARIHLECGLLVSPLPPGCSSGPLPCEPKGRCRRERPATDSPRPLHLL